MVCKFRAINKRLIESLVNAEVYFSPPPQLNDPFDCQIDIKKSLDTAIREVKNSLKLLKDIKANPSIFLEKVERDLKTYGVWSCSLEVENPLMWAHYGDEHRGVCLMYDLPDNFIDSKLEGVIGVSSVGYEKNPIVDWFVKELSNISDLDFQKFATSLMIKLLTSKDKCWKYEQEIRVISRNPGIKKIGKTALKRVCFGLRTLQSDKDLIQEILLKHDYDVTLCEMKRDHNDFGLRFKEI